jgi:sigma-B regulation protein RsbU (phosphoserine phosphatase)
MQEMLRQLQTVRALQRHLLPRKVPQLAGWDLAAHYAPGLWPGGDYYDFLTLPDGRVLMLVADASDQGAPAAALVAMVRVVLHSCPLSSGVERLPFCPLHEPGMQPPHVLLGHLNRVLAENSLEEQFLTAFCGLLNPADGNFHYANAGHPYPRCWRASSGIIEPLRDAVGLPLGVNAQASYHHKRIDLEPGDALVLYTDGLTAALNDCGQTFGHESLDGAIRRAAELGARAIKAEVLGALEEFLNGQEIRDDVTLVVAVREE